MKLGTMKAQIGSLARTLRDARIHEETINACCATLLFLKRLTDVAKHPRAAHSFISVEYPDLVSKLQSLLWPDLGKAINPGEELRNILRVVEASVPALDGLSMFSGLVYSFGTKTAQPQNVDRVFSALETISLVSLTDGEMARLYQETLEGPAGSAASAATPRSIRQLIGRLFANELVTEIYDPAGGTGPLLCEVGEKIRASGTHLTLYSQEIAVDLVNLARIRAFLDRWKFDFRAGDTLMHPEHGLREFDLIVSHPPFGMKIEPRNLPADHFERFQGDSSVSSETAFLQHVVASLSDRGRAAVLVPNGVLFRTGADQALRAELVSSGMLEGVVGLPAHLFAGTPISAAILVLRGREIAKRDTRIVIADLSASIEGQKTRPHLSEAGIEAAIRAVNSKECIPGFSTLIDPRDVADNAYNLSLARYVRIATPTAPSLETNLRLFEEARQLREKSERKALTLLRRLDTAEEIKS
jgi:type I restriction enzyme M protein